MDSIEIVYLSGFVIVTVIRKYFTSKNKPGKTELKVGTLWDKIFLSLIGISMLLPVIKVWIDLFPFANYFTIPGLQWFGMFVFFPGIYLLYRSHADLGLNWNPEVAINEKQILIQEGVYKRMRHPMYSAHILWALGNVLIFPNWIVGPSMLVFIIIFLIQRIKREEKLLIQEFGTQYEEYIKRTNSLIPRF